MTDPVLSSFAGRNPPNPVLAVTSGSPALELDPESTEMLISASEGGEVTFQLVGAGRLPQCVVGDVGH